MNAIKNLKSVLCDPSGEVSITGSDKDKRIIKEALAQLVDLDYKIKEIGNLLEVTKLSKSDSYTYTDYLISGTIQGLEMALKILKSKEVNHLWPTPT